MGTGSCLCFDLITGTLFLLFYEIIMVIVYSYFLTTSKLNETKDALYFGIVIYLSIRLGVAILGFCGVCLERPKCLKPFLFTSILNLIVGVIVIIVSVLGDTNKTKWRGYIALLYILISIAVVISVYFIIVIRSYLTQLEEKEKVKKNASQNTNSVA